MTHKKKESAKQLSDRMRAKAAAGQIPKARAPNDPQLITPQMVRPQGTPISRGVPIERDPAKRAIQEAANVAESKIIRAKIISQQLAEAEAAQPEQQALQKEVQQPQQTEFPDITEESVLGESPSTFDTIKGNIAPIASSGITKGGIGGGIGAVIGGGLGALGGPASPITIPLGVKIGASLGFAIGATDASLNAIETDRNQDVKEANNVNVEAGKTIKKIKNNANAGVYNSDPQKALMQFDRAVAKMIISREALKKQTQEDIQKFIDANAGEEFYDVENYLSVFMEDDRLLLQAALMNPDPRKVENMQEAEQQ